MSRLRGRRRVRYASVLVATVITVAFAYLAVRGVDLGELGQSLRESNYWWLIPALAALALAFYVRAVRWRSLFSPGTRPAVWPTTQALLVGQFFNNVLPLRAGDAARVFALHSFGGRSRAQTAATVVIERFFDVLALLLLLFVALPWFPEVGWIRAAGALAIVVTLALLAGVVVLHVYGDRALHFALRPLGRLPLFSERVDTWVHRLMQGLVGLRSARLGLAAFLWTLFSWLLLAASYWFVMLGFDLGLSPVAGLLAVIATGLSLILPSAPAAVGVFEAAAVVSLVAYGIPQTLALSYALVVHALNVLPFVAAGLVVLNLERGFLRGSTAGKRRDELVVSPTRGLEPPGLSPPVRGHSGGTGDDEDHVAEPADGQLDVDDIREPR